MSILERFKKQRSPEEEADFRVTVDVSRGYCKNNDDAKARQREFHLQAILKERGAADATSLSAGIHGGTQPEKPKKQGLFYKSNSVNTASGSEFMHGGGGGSQKANPQDVLTAYMEVMDEIKAEQNRVAFENHDQIILMPESGVYSPPPPFLAEQFEAGDDIAQSLSFITMDDQSHPIGHREEGKFRKLNKIVAVDRWKSIFKVEAKSSYGIRPAPEYNLPASIVANKGTSTFYVAFGWGPEDFSKITLFPASGVIAPLKRVDIKEDFFAPNQIPVRLDWHKIPDNAFEKAQEELENGWAKPEST